MINSGMYANEAGTFCGSGNLIGLNSVTSSHLATWTSHDAVAMWNFMHVSSISGRVSAAFRLKYKVIPETLMKASLNVLLWFYSTLKLLHYIKEYLCVECSFNPAKVMKILSELVNTVTFLSFRTDRAGQTGQTQIRLLLEKQSDQGLHRLPFRLYTSDSLFHGRATLLKFEDNYSYFSGVRIFRHFTVWPEESV